MKLNFINDFQFSWATVAVTGVQTGLSAYKYFKSQSEDKKAAAEGAALRRPFYSIPTEDIQNRNIAGQEAGQGLTSAEKQYAGEQREEGLGSSLEALKETGAGPNEFSGLSRIFDDSLKSQSALDAQLHKGNIEMFTKANSEISAKKGIQFGVNELQPYESKLQEIQNRRIAAQTNKNNAQNEAIGSLSAGATSFNSLMKQPGAAPAPTDYSNLKPYSRDFGLADTGATGFNSPSAGSPTMSAGALIQPVDTSDNH